MSANPSPRLPVREMIAEGPPRGPDGERRAPVGPPTPDPGLSEARRRLLDQRSVKLRWFTGRLDAGRMVALTFDDGPDPRVTPRILDVLRRAGAPATFFVVGANVVRHPELVRRIVAEGHDLGNHTYHHYRLPTLSPREIEAEIKGANRAIAGVVGVAPRWFRAPGCLYTREAENVIRRLNMVRVDTTDNSGDWRRPGVGGILRRVSEHLSPGDVLLFHDRVSQTAEALPYLLASLRRRGYRIVHLLELMKGVDHGSPVLADAWPFDEGVRIRRSLVGRPAPHRIASNQPPKLTRPGTGNTGAHPTSEADWLDAWLGWGPELDLPRKPATKPGPTAAQHRMGRPGGA